MTGSLPLSLLTLQNEQAPYRGHWHFERSSADDLQAVHTTERPDRPLDCVIERMQFRGRSQATLFARHLLNHGWAVQQLHEAGEALLMTSEAGS
jgi:hypothetical protein